MTDQPLEALINGSFVFGDPRLLNAFYPLAEAIPDKDSIDPVEVRKGYTNPFDLTARGEAYMERVFGAEDMGRFLKTMDEYWPDLRTSSTPLWILPTNADRQASSL